VRYYQVYVPGHPEPAIVTNLRRLRGLPDGTRIEAIVTERDGTLADSWEVPVVDGRPKVRQRGKDRPQYHGLR